MLKVTFHNLWLPLRASHVRSQITKHFLLVVRPLSSHGIVLDILVQILVWVQFRTCRWQRKNSNTTRLLLYPLLDGFRLMHRMPIQNHEELLTCLAEQPSQEPQQHGRAKRFLENHEAQMPTVGNRRDHVTAEA